METGKHPVPEVAQPPVRRYGFPHPKTLARRMVWPFATWESADMSFDRIRRLADRPYPGRIELAALAALYGAYELVRGFGSEDWVAARAHTADIVALERHLHLFIERDVQNLASALPGVPALLGFLYVVLHFAGTAVALTWVHRRRPHAFPFLRTTLIVSTALALVGYVLYPAAPPRLADLGFADTVTSHTGLNLSSDLLGSLYNPIAAVPSLHFGYSLIVGVALAQLAVVPLAALRRSCVPRRDAADHRRDRQPLHLRRRRRCSRRRRRLARRLPARGSGPSRRRCGSPHRKRPGRRIPLRRTPGQPELIPTHPNTPERTHPAMSPLKHSNNLAARMGRWSANHWKTAVFGWLAFVVASVFIGGAIGTKYLEDNDLAVGEAGTRDQDHRRRLPAVRRRAGRDRPDPVQDPEGRPIRRSRPRSRTSRRRSTRSRRCASSTRRSRPVTPT